MATQKRDVHKLDVQPLDMIRGAIAQGWKKLSIRQRSIKLNFWRGSFTADETLTTVEPNDDRH
jgi:hypothetical protein